MTDETKAFPLSSEALSHHIEAEIKQLQSGWCQSGFSEAELTEICQEFEALGHMAAEQIEDEGALEPGGQPYTLTVAQATLTLFLKGLEATTMVASQQGLSGEAKWDLIRQSAPRIMEQSKQLVKTSLSQEDNDSNPLPVSEEELKRYLSEAAISAMSFMLSEYERHFQPSEPKVKISQRTQTPEPILPSEEGTFPSEKILVCSSKNRLQNSFKTIVRNPFSLLFLVWAIVLVYFMPSQSTEWTSLMLIGFGAVIVWQIQIIQKQIQQTENQVNNLVHPQQAMYRLGHEVLVLEVANNLAYLTENDPLSPALKTTLTTLSQHLSQHFGYPAPHLNLRVSMKLEDNTYRIVLRGDTISQGEVLPHQVMLSESLFEAENIPPPEEATPWLDESTTDDVYWLPETTCPEALKPKAKWPAQVITNHVEKILFEHVDEILSLSDISSLLELACLHAPHLKTDFDNLPAPLVRKVWVNLLREKVPVSDVLFVLERFIEYLPESPNPDFLSERIRSTLARKICLTHADSHGMLYGIVVSNSWEHILTETLQPSPFGQCFNIPPPQVEALVETTVSRISYAQQTHDCVPVVLCSPLIRLPLYRLLVRYISTITVIGHNEVTADVAVEVVGTIDAE